MGDCNGDGVVSIDELITGVNVQLNGDPGDVCPALDCNTGLGVHIDCLLAAVSAALNGCPLRVPVQSPTPSLAPPTRSPTYTPTSCVSDPPDIYDDESRAQSDEPFLWQFVGHSRILQFGRGSVGACLNGRDPLMLSPPNSTSFTIAVTLAPNSTDLLEVCTFPAACGTSHCARRTITCGDSSCTVADLPPAPRTDPFCQKATPTPPPAAPSPTEARVSNQRR